MDIFTMNESINGLLGSGLPLGRAFHFFGSLRLKVEDLQKVGTFA